jgi:hypothetical protein
VRGDVCLWLGRRKKKGRKGTWVVGKIKGNKKEKRNGEWVKRGRGKERKKKLKGKKLNWFYLFVHFVWCKM